jgi:hypothetical protein
VELVLPLGLFGAGEALGLSASQRRTLARAAAERTGDYSYDILVPTLTGTTSITLDQLPPGASLSLRMVALDPAGNMSSPSAIASGRTLPDHVPPTRPRGLRLVNARDNGIELQWNPSHDDDLVAYYELSATARGSRHGGSAGCVHHRFCTGGASHITQMDTLCVNPRCIVGPLSAKTAYRIAVTAVDWAGNRSRPGHIRLSTTARTNFTPDEIEVSSGRSGDFTAAFMSLGASLLRLATGH